jgi:glycosyltransferase involved in cell wall biosynthesis
MEKAFDLFNVIKNPIVIPNSIDQSWMNLQFSKPNFNILGDFDGYTIAFIGNLVQVKNVLIIPDILERLSVYTNKKYRCVIIGDGPLKRELEYRFSKITGKVKVQYVNKVDREICIGLYKFIDIVLLPSFNEGLSMTLLESQAAGVRCIASDIPANRELIDSEFLVKLGENDVDEFAKRISLCFNMPKPDPYIRPQFRSENTSKLELLQYLAVLRN